MDMKLEAFKKLVPYLRGALWWGHNDLIKYEQPEFNQEDEHKGHPLLSVRKFPVESRFDVVPMLVGTSGTRMNVGKLSRCVMVTGMTKKDPTHQTYFGTIVEPGHYEFDDLLTGVRPQQIEVKTKDRHLVANKRHEKGALVRAAWHESRTMTPNTDKPMVDEREMLSLDRWCRDHHQEG